MLVLVFALAASSPLDRCLDAGEAAKGVTSAMSACFVADYKRADAQLNATYSRTMRRLPAARRVTFGRRNERGSGSVMRPVRLTIATVPARSRR